MTLFAVMDLCPILGEGKNIFFAMRHHDTLSSGAVCASGMSLRLKKPDGSPKWPEIGARHFFYPLFFLGTCHKMSTFAECGLP